MRESLFSGVLLSLLFSLGVQALTGTEKGDVYIITDRLKYTTEDEFLSFNLDPFLLYNVTPRWGTLDFANPRVLTLAAGLAPSILRYGGSDADWQTFHNDAHTTKVDNTMRFKPRNLQPNAVEPKVVLTPKDVDNLRKLAVTAGGKLLFDLNIQLRYGSQWDPDNAIQLMKYIIEKGYAGDMDFELGNEPEYPELDIDGTRIAEDFNILREVLDSLGHFNNSKLVGPDIGVWGTSGDAGMSRKKITEDFVKTVDKRLTAVTFHHYYFAGPGAHVSEYVDLRHFESLGPTLQAIRDVVTSAGGADLDVWVGETSDAYHQGTPNISDRFASGFLWMDKLGTAASHGFKLVARQTFYGGNYPLLSLQLQPNPDYWLSFVFKRLVGRGVLDAEVFTSVTAVGYARAYAHCTSPRARYPNGSVTLYAINLLQSSPLSLYLDQSLGPQTVDVYLLSPDGSEGLISPYVALNGKRLALVDDHTLPSLVPVTQPASSGLFLPPLTFGFFVFPNMNASACKLPA